MNSPVFPYPMGYSESLRQPVIPEHIFSVMRHDFIEVVGIPHPDPMRRQVSSGIFCQHLYLPQDVVDSPFGDGDGTPRIQASKGSSNAVGTLTVLWPVSDGRRP